MRRSGLLGSPPLLSVRVPNVAPSLSPLWLPPHHHQAPTLRQALLSPLRRATFHHLATASARPSPSTATMKTTTTLFLHLVLRSQPNVFVAPRLRLRQQCLRLRMLHTTTSRPKTSSPAPEHPVTDVLLQSKLHPPSHLPDHLVRSLPPLTTMMRKKSSLLPSHRPDHLC